MIQSKHYVTQTPPGKVCLLSTLNLSVHIYAMHYETLESIHITQ